MKKNELKKLWLHSLCFISLIFLTLLIFGVFAKWKRTIWNSVPPLDIILVITIFYSRFMLKWFRKMKQAKKPGNWDYLIYRWTKLYWFGVLFMPFFIILGLIYYSSLN